MERYYSGYNLKDISKGGENFALKNSFCLPLMSFFSEYCDAYKLNEIIDRFSEMDANKIIEELLLTEEDYELLTKKCIFNNLQNGGKKLGILTIMPKITKQAFEELGMKGRIYIRARDIENIDNILEDFDKSDIGLGIFLDPYIDGDEIVNEVSNLSAKHKLPVIVSIFDDIEKVGLLNTMFDVPPVNYLENVGLLDRECAILGGIYADKEDFSLLANYGTKIIVSPYDFLNLGKGIANTYAMINSGVDVEIASIINCNVIEEIKIMSALARGTLNNSEILPIEELLERNKFIGKGRSFNQAEFNLIKAQCEKIYEKIKEKI